MKKAIVLGAAMLLAGAAAFAADVKFSGRIRVGYNFQFGDTDQTTLKKNPEGRMNLTIADSDSLWTITFDAANNATGEKVGGFSDHYYRAKATIALDKALKGAGVDLGDVSLKAFGGYYDWYETKNAYNDNPYSDNDVDRMELNVGTQTDAASIVGVTVGYGKLVSVEAVSAPYGKDGDGLKPAFAFTATSTPVDGVQVGAGYGHNVVLGKGNKFGRKAYNDAINASANVDIAKLIKNDKFSLAAAGDFQFGFEDKDDNQKQYIQALGRVSGGVEKVDGYVEYAYTTIDDLSPVDTYQYMRAQVNLNMVKGLGLDVYYQDYDLTNEKKEDDFEIGAEAVYTFGGVDYHLDVAYKAKKDNDNFKITPWIQIAF